MVIFATIFAIRNNTFREHFLQSLLIVSFIRYIGDFIKMDEICITEVPTQKVIGIRKKGKCSLIAQLLPQLYEFATSNGSQIIGKPFYRGL